MALTCTFVAMQTLRSSRFDQSIYFSKGKGSTLLLIHGFAEDHQIWQELMEDLGSRYHLLAPDLPGSGRSPLPKEDLSMEALADFIIEIMEAEKITKATILGHSMGGYVMMALLEKYPQRVEAIGFIHSTSMNDDEAKKEIRAKAIRLIKDYPNGKDQFLSTMVPNLFSATFRTEQPTVIQEHLTRASKITSEALVAYYYAMMERKNRVSLIRNLKIPVLFIIGSEDMAVPKSQTLQECYLPMISAVHIMKKTAHMSMYENGKALNKTVKSFLDVIYPISK